MRIAFLLNDLEVSGGVIAILSHVRGLAKTGHTVDVILCHGDISDVFLEEVQDLRIQRLDAVGKDAPYDLAVSTWWETNFSLGKIPAVSYAFFCQSLEDRFYPGADQRAWEVRSAVSCGVPVITEATWIAEQLRLWLPDLPVRLARNGLEHYVFHSDGRTAAYGPLRVLVEGAMSSEFKGVEEALLALTLCREPIAVTHVSSERKKPEFSSNVRHVGPYSALEMASLYRETDVLVKLSRVEGMFGPPLEAFGCGATAIVTPVTGHDEYIRDGENALVVPWDNPHAVAKAVDNLARNPRLLASLQSNANKTASAWPSWEQSTAEFHLGLMELMDVDSRMGFASRTAVKGLTALGWLSAATRGSVNIPRRTVVPQQTASRRRDVWS